MTQLKTNLYDFFLNITLSVFNTIVLCHILVFLLVFSGFLNIIIAYRLSLFRIKVVDFSIGWQKPAKDEQMTTSEIKVFWCNLMWQSLIEMNMLMWNRMADLKFQHIKSRYLAANSIMNRENRFPNARTGKIGNKNTQDPYKYVVEPMEIGNFFSYQVLSN